MARHENDRAERAQHFPGVLLGRGVGIPICDPVESAGLYRARWTLHRIGLHSAAIAGAELDSDRKSNGQSVARTRRERVGRFEAVNSSNRHRAAVGRKQYQRRTDTAFTSQREGADAPRIVAVGAVACDRRPRRQQRQPMEGRIVEQAVEVVDWIASPRDVVALRKARSLLAPRRALRARGTVMRTGGILVMSS